MTSPLLNNIVTLEGNRLSEHFLDMLSYPLTNIWRAVSSSNHHCREPLELTVCGLSLALSAMLIEAARDAIAKA